MGKHAHLFSWWKVDEMIDPAVKCERGINLLIWRMARKQKRVFPKLFHNLNSSNEASVTKYPSKKVHVTRLDPFKQVDNKCKWC